MQHITPLARRIAALAAPLAILAFSITITPQARAQSAAPAGPPLEVRWVGQTGEDKTGNPDLPMGNGVADLIIAVKQSSLEGTSPIQWTIGGDAQFVKRLAWEWPPTARLTAGIYVELREDEYWLFFDPFLTVPGDIFRVAATTGDGLVRMGSVAGAGVTWGERTDWCGQSDFDFVGDVAQPNGCKDWMIEVGASALKGKSVKNWTVWLDYLGYDNYFHDVWTTDPATEGKPIHAVTQGNGAKLYFDPALAREGDQFLIQAILNDGTTLGWTLAGGGSDWGKTAIYNGRIDEDRISDDDAQPNGVNDITLSVYDPAIQGGGVKRVAVQSAGKRWGWPPKEGIGNFMLADVSAKSITIRLDNDEDRAGEFYFVSAVLSSGKMVGWSVMTSRTNSSTDVEWMGQVEDLLGPAQMAEPDGELDLGLRVKHPLLNFTEVKKWEIMAGSRCWGDQEPGKEVMVSGIRVEGTAGSDERILYFSEASPGGNQPVIKGTKYTVTATLADGNLIHWRLASPGSPMLTGARWDGSTKDNYIVSFDNPGFLMGAVRIMDEGRLHTWRTKPEGGGQADAAASPGAKRISVNLSRDKMAITQGQMLRIEAKDSRGTRYYGTLFAGKP